MLHEDISTIRKNWKVKFQILWNFLNEVADETNAVRARKARQTVPNSVPCHP
jgi:hypothetical protein